MSAVNDVPPEQALQLDERQPNSTASNPPHIPGTEFIPGAPSITLNSGSKVDIQAAVTDEENSTGERSASQHAVIEEAALELEAAAVPPLSDTEALPYFSNYDFHYDREFVELLGLRQIFEYILQDLASQHDIHDWDKKSQTRNPMKKLLAFANRELYSPRFGRGSHLARIAGVEEICTILEQNKSLAVPCDLMDEKRGFFPNKVSCCLLKVMFCSRMP